MSLPSGYKRLEYIQSSGTQYIDTGFKPNQNTRVYIDIAYTQLGTYGCLFGAEDDSNLTNGFELWETPGNNISFYYGVAENMVQKVPTPSIGGRHRYNCNKNVLTVDEIDSLTNGTRAFSCGHTLCLFAIIREGRAQYFTKFKLFSAKIYDNGTLIRDFIPCKNASGVIGLWDDANGKFYTNAGTGVFSAGPEVAGAHKALINGTAYEMKSGKCLINGTSYAIKKGRTLIDGTVYDIALQSNTNSLAWHLDEVVDVSYDIDAAIGFYSNDERYIGIRIANLMGRCLMYRRGSDHVWSTRYLSGKWDAEGYRTLVFDELPTGALLEWLQANGTAI